MNLPPDMPGIERRLQKTWDTRIRHHPSPVRRETYWLRDGWRAFAASGMVRFLTWCAALTPFPQSWHFCAIFATMAAYLGAAQLSRRGRDESILSLYGGSDRDLLSPTRQRQTRRILWGAADALVILGVWWLQGRIPGWVIFLGVPAYASAVGIGPRILVAVVPELLLALIARGGGFLVMLLAIPIGQMTRPGPLSESLFWVLGMASPSGWVVLMLHGLLAGKDLLWGFVPLLVASGFAARAFAKAQDESLAESVNAGARELPQEPAFREPTGEEFSGDPPSEGTPTSTILPGTLDFTDAWQVSRDLELLDLPRGKRPAPFPWKKAAWTAGIFLGLAVLARPEFAALGSLPMLAFSFAITVGYAVWLPLLGLPEWLWHAPLSLNRVVAIFALFPIPFRRVIGLQMRHDLRVAARVLPGLTGLVFLAFEVAFSPPLLVALGAAVVLSLAAFLLLPLRWFRLTLWPQSNKPFRLARIGQGALIMVMACLFLLKAVFIIIAAFLAFGELALSPDRYWMAVVALVLGAGNATAAMAGVWLGLRAHERARYDLVKTPQKS